MIIKDLFSKYQNALTDFIKYKEEIDSLVNKYVEKTVGFIKEAGNVENVGKTSQNEISWHISNADEITIRCSVYADRWLDFYKPDEVIIRINYNQLYTKTMEE